MPVRFDIFHGGMVKKWKAGRLLDVNRSDIAGVVTLEEENDGSLFTGLRRQRRVGRCRTFAAGAGVAQ